MGSVNKRRIKNFQILNSKLLIYPRAFSVKMTTLFKNLFGREGGGSVESQKSFKNINICIQKRDITFCILCEKLKTPTYYNKPWNRIYSLYSVDDENYDGEFFLSWV